MVKKTLNKLVNKINGLNEAVFWLALFSLFSQLLALFRDRLLTHNFGVGHSLDVYYASFKIPDIIFVTVASIVSISALVPIFAKKETQGEKHLKDAANSIFTTFALAIIVFCLVAFFAMPYIINSSFKGLDQGSLTQVILFSRVLLLSPLLLGFSNFFGSIVQYEKRFILYSLSPILYNAGIILGLILLKSKFGIASAIYGVILGSVLHLSLQALYIMLSPMRPKFISNINWKDVLDTAKLSVPRTLALSVTSFVSFIFAIFASYMSTGSIAIFNLSWNLQSAPVSLIGASFSLAAFPALALSFAKNHMNEVRERISEGVRKIIFWSIPFSVFVIVLRAHIVRVILGSGVFDWQATRLVAGVLAVFVISLVFQNILIFLSRSHYALGKTRWPLFANIFGGVSAVISALVFLKFFTSFDLFFGPIAQFLKIEDLSYEIILLPFSFATGSLIGAFILFFALGREIYRQIFKDIKSSIYRVFVSSSFLGIASYYALKFLDDIFHLDTFLGVLSNGFFAGIFGIVIWAFVLYIMKDQDFNEILGFLKKKLNI